MYRSVRTLVRLVTTTLVLSLTATAALVAAGTTAASATTTFTVTGQQQLPAVNGQMPGPVGFSYTSAGVPMSRNVLVATTGAAPNSQVWFGVHDTTDPNVNAWYGGWKQADASGNTQVLVTGIPASACGHVLQVSASYNWSVGAPNQYITDFCGPMISVNASGNVVGDGFAPGQTVTVTVQAVNLARTWNYTTRYTTTTYTSSTGAISTVTSATTTANLVGTSYSTYTAVQVVSATAAGQFSAGYVGCSTYTATSTSSGTGYTTTTATTTGLSYADITVQYAGLTRVVQYSC